MEVSRIRALRGPNLWSRQTSIEAVVRCTPQELAIDSIPEFEQRLRARFPQIGALRPAGFEGPVSAAHALEVAALSLQAEAGCPVSFSRTAPTHEAEVFQVVVQYSEEAVGRLAMDLAVSLYEAAQTGGAFDSAEALARLKALDEDIRMGPSTGSIAQAAAIRGIPIRRLTDGSLVQFGWGSRSRRIQAAEVDSTSAIAESIAQDKELTKQLLAAVGVPVPVGRVVRSVEQAIDALRAIGGAVVVKPRDGNQGKGVTVNLTEPAQVEKAYHAALEHGSSVLVERFIPGHDHRILVVGDRVVAAARRDPPHVIGDGERSIRELVDEVNRDPRRGEGHASSLTRIRFDEIALARMREQGFDADSVPAKGVRVVLRNNANLSTGGSATDVTDDVHPEIVARAVEAARVIGLHIAGIDLVCDNVLQPLEEQGGAVVEVNAAPGLRMHISPSYGKGRDVGDAIIRLLFQEGDEGRIPVVAVTGTNGKTTTVRLIAAILATSGKRVGMTSTEGVFVDGQCVDTGDCSGPRSARNVLMHPQVDAAVFETARGGILREGLGFDRCQVAVVTNLGAGDHLGLNYLNTVEDLAVLKRVIVNNVASSGHAVLNAADPHVVAMQETCPGSVIFFAADPSLPVMTRHRALGLPTVHVAEGQIVACRGPEDVHRIDLARVPLTRGGTIAFQVENVLAAVAAAWALGIDWSLIAATLAAFDSDARTVPGRFNVFSYRGATLIADYGHNPDAIRALSAAAEAMPARRRTIVISAAGDRRDQDIREQAVIVGQHFDEAILYQDAAQRGRADGEVLSLLRDGLLGARRTRRIDEVRGEFLAIDHALARVGEGDLCLILIDQVQEALEHLSRRLAEG
jgi:cyanophycin synthetase